MWVFCGGMFRSGSTVQYQVAAHVAETAGRGCRLPFAADGDLGAATSSVQAAAQADTLLVCKSHAVSDAIRLQVHGGRGIVLTIHRDIRDVVVSAMSKNSWSFRKIWRSDKLRYWTSRFDEWAALPGALVSRYDDLVADLPREVGRIATHIGCPVGAADSATIAAAYSIDRQRSRTAAVRQQRQIDGPALKFDPHSLLHHNHIASGATGQYREVLRPAEIRAIEDECGEWMARWGYLPDRPVLTIGQRLRRLGYWRAA